MTRRTLAALVGLLASAVGPVGSQMYHVYMEDDGVGVPYVETPDGLRFLQLDTGNRPDINSSKTDCVNVGAKYQCKFSTRINAMDKSYANLEFQVLCDLNSQVAFDFRRSKGCTCGAWLTYSNVSIPRNYCPCVVCPDSFGSAPVSVDCSGNISNYSYVINTCSSLDCSFSCNGTCNFGCNNPDTASTCNFCTARDTIKPTKAPTKSDALSLFNVISTLAVLVSVAVLNLYMV